MIVHVDVEFLVHGENAAALIGSALSKLEQLNDGPLPAGVVPWLSEVGPDGTPGSGPCAWQAKVSATLRRDVEYADGGGEDELAVSEVPDEFWRTGR